MNKKTVGYVNKNIINILNLNINNNTPIFIGDTNIKHMKKKHYKDYMKYGLYINTILSFPDYVGKNPSDNSIEYVKEFKIDHEYVKVAVRVSTTGSYYVRSLYVLNNNRVQNFINKGFLHKI